MKFYEFGKKENPVIFLFPGTCCHWRANAILTAVLGVCGYVSVVAGFFIHTDLCIQSIIYKRIMEENRFALADAVLEKYYRAVMPPFAIG